MHQPVSQTIIWDTDFTDEESNAVYVTCLNCGKRFIL